MPNEKLTYRTQGPLATGGMAKLDRIVLSDGKPAVLRQMKSLSLLNFRQRKFFKRGAQIRAALTPHPNIVSSLEIGSHFLAPYEIIEYVSGQPLRNLMTLNDPTLKLNTEHVLLEMAEALAWVHDNGFMHLDVKPENFLLKRAKDTYTVKLTDFDLARVRADHGPHRQLGTPGYMAPEQFKRHKCHQASDVFAFGIIAYELLTGRRPFSGKTPKDMWRHQASKRYLPRPLHDFVPQIPPKLEYVILACLNKEREKRYHDMRQVLNALK